MDLLRGGFPSVFGLQVQTLEPGQVRTNAGGCAFTISKIGQLRRMLYLGCAENLYSSEQENVNALAQIVKSLVDDGKIKELVDLIKDCRSVARPDPVLWTYAAMVFLARTPDEKRTILTDFNCICRTPTHVMSFLESYKLLRKSAKLTGKGICKMLKKVIALKFHGNAVAIALVAAKYKGRHGWKQRDLLRISHPTPKSCAEDLLYHWIVYGHESFMKKAVAVQSLMESSPLQIESQTVTPHPTPTSDHAISYIHKDDDFYLRNSNEQFKELDRLSRRHLREFAEEKEVPPNLINKYGDETIDTTSFIFGIQSHIILQTVSVHSKTPPLGEELADLQDKMSNLNVFSKYEIRQFAAKWVTDEQYKAFGDNEIRQQPFIGLVYNGIYEYYCPIDTTPISDGPVEKLDVVKALSQAQAKKNKDLCKPFDEHAASLVEFIDQYNLLFTQPFTTEDEPRAVAMIQKYKLSHMSLPSEMLNSRKIWQALLPSLGLEALIRNLPKITNLRLISDDILSRLANQSEINAAMINPIKALYARKTYNLGRNIKGKQTWVPDDRVKLALDKTFQLSFNGEPTGKHYLIAMDVSGSMQCAKICDMEMTCAEASAAIAMMFVRLEENTKTMAFSGNFIELDIRPDDDLDVVMEKTAHLPFNFTRIDVAIKTALERRIKVDVFIILTDNDCGYGEHPHKVLADYQRIMQIPARVVVIGMVSNKFTVAEPGNACMMDIVGFDTATPEIIREFALGNL